MVGCRKISIHPDVTLCAFLSQVLSHDGSCQDAVNRVFIDRLQRGLPQCALGTASYTKARQKLSEEGIIDLTKAVADDMSSRTPAAWLFKNHRVLMIDGSSLTMADTEENQAEYPRHNNQKEGCGYPLARIEALTNLENGALTDFTMSSFQGKGTGELSLGKKLLESLAGGEILLADAFYTAYSFMALVLQKNADLSILLVLKILPPVNNRPA